MARTVIENCVVVTVDDHDNEYAPGHVVVDGELITAVGPGPAPAAAKPSGTTVVDGAGHLLTPGLVNTHHHLYQWLTRGWAQDAILFDWLTALYPAWAQIDADLTRSAALGAMAVLATSGCTTVGDHHYVFPQGSGDIVGGIVDAASTLGLRLTATRGSMDLGSSQGGLPPDFACETTDQALQASADAVDRYHDASYGSMVHVSVAPCSPFSVTTVLLEQSALLARDKGVRMHTHGSETVEEDAFCAAKFGLTPTDYLEECGWLGSDVWMAHCVQLDASSIAKFAATGTGVAHCPSSNARLAAGIAPVPQLLAAGAPVGLGVDGCASNEDGRLGSEIRQSLLVNRLRSGADSITGRQVLAVATRGGARVLGRQHEIGTIEVGKIADLVLWKVDGIEHAGIADPVAALTLSSLPPVTLSLVHGRPVVADGHLTNADELTIAREVEVAAAELARRALNAR